MNAAIAGTSQIDSTHNSVLGLLRFGTRAFGYFLNKKQTILEKNWVWVGKGMD
jgi:hypothetical protein